MKSSLIHLIEQSLNTLKSQGIIPAEYSANIQLDRSKDPAHGDWACNIALMSAKVAGKKPRDMAELIVNALPQNNIIEKLDIAGPGFINIFVSAQNRFAAITAILNNASGFSSPNIGNGEKVLLEFVSANPTGPMHVGHGRGAAYGSALANLLKATGYAVQREYYINDAGRQTDVLTISVYLRYLEMFGESVHIPSRAYPSDYVKDCAQAFEKIHGKALFYPYATVTEGLPNDPDGEGDDIKTQKEQYLDAVINKVQTLLGATQYRLMQDFALNTQLDTIKATLAAFNVEFDAWFSERSLLDSGAISKALSLLKERGHTYEKNGALWLATSQLGDEKDRVLVRDNGIHTYFAADVAYHLEKLERGFDTLIDVWGADHHGYIARVRAAIEALTGQGDRFHVALIQFVTLSSGKMGKRSGNFVTLSQLIEEAGMDATRFFYLTRSPEQHLEFDIDLARSETAENPVYYLQYAHARVCSMFRELTARNWTFDATAGLANLPTLNEPMAEELAKRLASWPETVASAAKNRAPQQLCNGLREIAQEFHAYYNQHKILVDEENVRNARLTLCFATKEILANGLSLLGVSASEKM